MMGSLQRKTPSPCPTVHSEQTSQTMQSGYISWDHPGSECDKITAFQGR